MKTFYQTLFFLCLAGHALAQPAAEGPVAADGPTQHEQRRAELRHALQAQRQVEQTRDARRQLSPQEREELRQQLRQQHQGTGKARP